MVSIAASSRDGTTEQRKLTRMDGKGIVCVPSGEYNGRHLVNERRCRPSTTYKAASLPPCRYTPEARSEDAAIVNFNRNSSIERCESRTDLLQGSPR